MRYWEIDFARGIAVILMLAFHLFFDAYYFGKIVLSGLFWYFFPRFIGGMFIFISGFTMSVVYKRNYLRRAFKKIAKLALIAIGITVATYIFARDEVVVFGIIHFFTLATLIGLLFLRKPKLCLTLGAILFALGIYFLQLTVSFPYLVWLGLAPYNFATLDYYPFLPWFGVFLIGMGLGYYYKPFRNTDFPGKRFVEKLGQNSLKIYLIQHPVIVLLLQLVYGDIFRQILFSIT